MTATEATITPDCSGFEHLALIFSGEDEFLAGAVPFLRDGIADGEPMLVAVTAPRIAALRAALRQDADDITFVNMAELGANPARIIPAWREFLGVNAEGTRPVRGIGEPIWAGRSPAELVECQRHESLLNVAFAGSGDWQLLCPYDADALSEDVIEEAHRSHPVIMESGARRPSDVCRDLDVMASPCTSPLPEPGRVAAQVSFTRSQLASVRQLVSNLARVAGFDAVTTAELALAVHEIAANSILHGGGAGELRAWEDGDTLVCEVRDRGRIEHPLVGRVQPPEGRTGGRGVWLANQLCNLVQIRTTTSGNVVRVHMHRRSGSTASSD